MKSKPRPIRGQVEEERMRPILEGEIPRGDRLNKEELEAALALRQRLHQEAPEAYWDTGHGTRDTGQAGLVKIDPSRATLRSVR